MKKLKIKALNGFVYVESFNRNKNEENERAKIFDENGEYLDYISLDGISKQQYKNALRALSSAKNFEEFAELLGQYSYDYSENLKYLMASIYDDFTQEDFDEMEKDLKKMEEHNFLKRYMINRVGDYYFFFGE